MNTLQRLLSLLRNFRSSLAAPPARPPAAAPGIMPASANSTAPPAATNKQASAGVPVVNTAPSAAVPPAEIPNPVSLASTAARWLSGLGKSPISLRGPLLIAVAVLLVLFWMSHDAALRQQYELQQVRRQAGAQIAALRVQSDALVRQATTNAAAVQQQLAEQRRVLQQTGSALDARLAASRASEQQALARLAAQPAEVIAASVKSQLASSPIPAPPAGLSASALAAPAPGVGSSSPTPGASFSFSEANVRSMAASLEQLSACRAQSALQDAKFSNLQAQLAASDTAVTGLQHSVSDLQNAAHLKDDILARKDAEYQAELKAVRGTRASRLLRAAKFIAVGFVAGMVVR
jgi:hypothetical protein